MKIICCGVVYSTDDPETYWCIETYDLKHPFNKFIEGKKVSRQVIYLLCCKKNGCTKLELCSYGKENGQEKVIEIKSIKGKGAISFLKKTKHLRIKLPQICPIKARQDSVKIPWVYGKAISKTRQVIRYIDESGNRAKLPESKIKVIKL